MLDLIVSVPDHCLSFYSIRLKNDISFIFIVVSKKLDNVHEKQ